MEASLTGQEVSLVGISHADHHQHPVGHAGHYTRTGHRASADRLHYPIMDGFVLPNKLLINLEFVNIVNLSIKSHLFVLTPVKVKRASKLV